MWNAGLPCVVGGGWKWKGEVWVTLCEKWERVELWNGLYEMYINASYDMVLLAVEQNEGFKGWPLR